jgi:hypothetical protein
MGDRGPVPKRDATRRRRNKNSQAEQIDPVIDEVPVPEMNDDWHPMAQQWFASLSLSAQAQFYEPSDWALAVVIADSISRQMSPQVVGVNPVSGEPIFGTVPANGAQIQAWLKAMHVLMATEGDRRRFRVEVDRSGTIDDHPEVPNLNDYRSTDAAGDRSRMALHGPQTATANTCYQPTAWAIRSLASGYQTTFSTPPANLSS